MPSLPRLKERLARSLRAGQIDSALSAVAAISAIEPKDPIWPKRAARLCRAADDLPGQLEAHRRALELEVGQGLVLEAIASCRSILEIVPDDEETLDCLDLLYLSGSTPLQTEDVHAEQLPESEAVREDAPLDSMLLSELVPGARSIALGETGSEGANEIPLDDPGNSAARGAVDLRLDEWSPPDAASSEPKMRSRAEQLGVKVAAAETTQPRGQSLRKGLAAIPLFGELDSSSLRRLLRKVRVVNLGAGDVLFRQGDDASSLFVVVDGAVVPIAEGTTRRKLAVLERGDFFGEIGLITKQPRNATIEALVETKLLAIDRRLLWQLIETESSVPKILMRFLRARLIDRLIRTHPFFAAFALAKREAVARAFRMLEVRDGTRVMAASQPPKGLFVVLAGQLELRHPRNGVLVKTLGPGEVLGAAALLSGEASTQSAVARGKCWIVLLDEKRFRQMLAANARLESVLVELAASSDRSERDASPSAISGRAL